MQHESETETKTKTKTESESESEIETEAPHRPSPTLSRFPSSMIVPPIANHPQQEQTMAIEMIDNTGFRRCLPPAISR